MRLFKKLVSGCDYENDMSPDVRPVSRDGDPDVGAGRGSCRVWAATAHTVTRAAVRLACACACVCERGRGRRGLTSGPETYRLSDVHVPSLHLTAVSRHRCYREMPERDALASGATVTP